jgi:hypothetical protein
MTLKLLELEEEPPAAALFEFYDVQVERSFLIKLKLLSFPNNLDTAEESMPEFYLDTG